MELLKMIYTCIIRQQVKLLALENCNGCITSHGSQAQHMGPGGCLDEEMNNLNYYMNEARKNTPVSKALDIIKQLYEKYNMAVPAIFLDPVDLPTLTGADVYTYCLLENDDYNELFNSLNEKL
jgi:hypothetical protein